MRNTYPSDTTREEFEMIREELEKVSKKTHPSVYDLYDIFCAVLYLVKEGCTWRGLPHDFPKWQNVRYHYDKWSKTDENGISTLDKILQKLVKMERKKTNERRETQCSS